MIIGEKSLHASRGVEGQRNHLKIFQSILFLTRPAFRRNYFTRAKPTGSEATWGKCSSRLQLPRHPVQPKGGKTLRSLVELMAQGHMFTETLRPAHRTVERSHSCTPGHSVTLRLLAAVSFTQCFVYLPTEKLLDILKGKTKPV